MTANKWAFCREYTEYIIYFEHASLVKKEKEAFYRCFKLEYKYYTTSKKQMRTCCTHVDSTLPPMLFAKMEPYGTFFSDGCFLGKEPSHEDR